MMILTLGVFAFSGCADSNDEIYKKSVDVQVVVGNKVRFGMTPEEVQKILEVELNISEQSYDDRNQVVKAIIRNVSNKALTSGNISLTFKFSKDLFLESYVIKPIFTGP